MAMRQTTRFSVVSSIQDDSFGSKHLPSAIYALAKTARGETAACSHPRRSTFTVRALHGVRSRLTRELDLSLMVVEQFVADIENLCSQITKFTTTYAPTTPSVCDCLSVWRRRPQLSVQASLRRCLFSTFCAEIASTWSVRSRLPFGKTAGGFFCFLALGFAGFGGAAVASSSARASRARLRRFCKTFSPRSAS